MYVYMYVVYIYIYVHVLLHILAGKLESKHETCTYRYYYISVHTYMAETAYTHTHPTLKRYDLCMPRPAESIKPAAPYIYHTFGPGVSKYSTNYPGYGSGYSEPQGLKKNEGIYARQPSPN